MLVRHLFIFILGVLILLACVEEPNCELETASEEFIIKFYDEEDSTLLEVEMLRLDALGGDSIFYADTLDTFVLPLNPIADQVTYLFRTSSSRDTLSVKYHREIEWLSESCGSSFVFSDLEILYTTFVADLVSTQIDNTVDENISIYY
jgi:hypothetical protein